MPIGAYWHEILLMDTTRNIQKIDDTIDGFTNGKKITDCLINELRMTIKHVSVKNYTIRNKQISDGKVSDIRQ